MKARNFLLISSIIFLSCKESAKNIDLTTVSKIDTVVKKNIELKNEQQLKSSSTSKQENTNISNGKPNNEVNQNRNNDKRLIVVFEGKVYYKKNLRDEPYKFCPEDEPSKVIFFNVLNKKYYDITTGNNVEMLRQGRPCKGENAIPEPKLKQILKEIIVTRDSIK